LSSGETVTKKEKARQDISTAFDFVRFMMKHPGEIGKIPEGAEIVVSSQSQPDSTDSRKTGSKAHYWAERTFRRV
jgi:hypothetical protein